MKRFKIYHVEGHQDSKALPSDLTLPEKINIICDDGYGKQLLTEYQEEQETRPREPLRAEVTCMKI